MELCCLHLLNEPLLFYFFIIWKCGKFNLKLDICNFLVIGRTKTLYVWAAAGEQRQTGVLLGCIYFYWESEAAVCLQAGWRTDCIYIPQLWGPHHKHGRVFMALQQCHTESHFIFTATYEMKRSISSSFLQLHCWPSSVNLKKTNQSIKTARCFIFCVRTQNYDMIS